MNVIFKVITDILHRQKQAEKEKQRQAAAQAAAQAGAQEGDDARRCPVCNEPAGEHDTECPSCGARLD